MSFQDATGTSARDRWGEVPAPTDGRVPVDHRPWAGPLIVTAMVVYLASRGHVVVASAMVLAALVGLQISALVPAAARAFDAFGHKAGAAVSFVLLGLLLGLVIVPLFLITRVLRWNPLEFAAAGGRWQRAMRNRGRLPRRLFQKEATPRSLAAQAHGLAVGAVVALAVAGGIYGVRWLMVDTGAEGQFTAFGGRAEDGDDADDADLTFNRIPISLSSFPGEPWAGEVLEAQSHLPTAHDDVLGWRLLDFESEYVNVTDDARRTLATDDPEVTIWMFGGSTTFGMGQRDHHTIASALVDQAARVGVRLDVVNYGVSGWVNWQETALFKELLGDEEPPDIALFYDGANDIALSWQREVWGLLDTDDTLFLAVSEEEQRKRERSAEQRGYEEEHDPNRQATLAAEQYRRGVRWGRRLADDHGVEVMFFWQPTLNTLPADRPGVDEVADNLDYDLAFQDTAEYTVDEAARLSGVDPIDLTDIFDDVDRPVFFDWAHANEAGARLQAEAVWDHLETVVDELVE